MLPTPPCGHQNSASMKHRILLALLIFISTNLALNAQNVTVRATVGTDSADYTTLKGAFDAINLGTHKEVIRIRLKGPTNEGNTTETLNGIYEPGLADMTSKIWFNTVYLNGAPTSGSLNSACLYYAAGSSNRDFRNNIFHNARSNSGATGKHYAIYLSSLPTTIDYNDYYVSGTGGILGYYGGDITTLDDWKAATGKDTYSLNTNPTFANAGGTNAVDYIPTTLLPAASGTGIITD